MAINWAYQAPQDSTDEILGAYGQGQKVAQDRERKSALSAYLPGALGGDKAAVGQVAAVDPSLGIQLTQMLQGADEKKRQQSLENWDFIGTILQKPDGSPISSPEEIQHAKTLAIARGLPSDQVNQVTPESIPQLIQVSQSARTYARQAQQDAMTRKVSEANIRQSDASVRASDAAVAVSGRKGNVDPNTGARVPPAGVQGRDFSEIAKAGQSADAAMNIANTLRSVRASIERLPSGTHMLPGQRSVAGAMAVLPGAQGGRADQFTADYDAVEQASKVIGIDTLQKVGGSDTERELLTAIETTVNTKTPKSERVRRYDDALAASDILSKKAQMMTEWVNAHGSLMYAAPNGMTWQQFWPKYQKAAWSDHLQKRDAPKQGPDYRQEQRDLMSGRRTQGGPPIPEGFEPVE